MALLHDSNDDPDFLLALAIHNEINGAEAQQVLQVQRQREYAEFERTNSQLPLLPHGNESPPWLSASKNYPWQVIRPASASTSVVPLARSIIASPGKITKPGSVKIEKKKLVYASHQLNSSLVTNVNVAGPSSSAGPSTSASFATPPKVNNLPPIRSVIDNKSSGNVPEQIIKLLPKRTSPNDFHIQAFNSFLDLNASLDQWKILPQTEPNLQFIFQKLRNRFFRSIPKLKDYWIKWDVDTITDLRNFSITTHNRQILLNRKTLLNCTRANLLSVLFHTFIHCSVFESSQARNKNIYVHDANFTEITKFFNEKLDLEIGTDHTFIRGAVEDLVTYQCQGKCATSLPFNGVIMVKNHDALPTLLSTSSHQRVCGGKFHRVFEVTRVNDNNNNTAEVHHIVHKVFSDPKVASSTEIHANATPKPRELVDITDDDETHDPKVVAMTPIIDLDDEEFSDFKKKGTRKVVEYFKAIPNAEFETCPICLTLLNNFGGSLRLHIDLCLGTTISWN